ncbi:MAG: patatin-like phospholipase family protein [Pyrinomonadaceae bacterium]
MADYNSLNEARRAYARTLRSALCLSGGGIRSATFNLGVLQGLARHGLLEQFDYLSTVSGGGFIGGWLTAWLHRSGTETVMRQLTQPPPSPVDPEPHPINHLRVFSNYLSPRPGLLSADTWTLISTLLRNLLLTWLVFVPFLALALLVPRAWMAIVAPATPATDATLFWSFWTGMTGAWIALTFTGLALARKKEKRRESAEINQYKNREFTFLVGCLLPGVVSASAFAVYWARLTKRLGDQVRAHCSWPSFVLFAISLVLVPWLFTFVYRLLGDLTAAALRTPGAGAGKFFNLLPFLRNSLTTIRATSRILLRLLLATGLIFVAQGVAGTLLYALLINVFAHPEQHQRLYATLSVPLVISVLLTGCALIAGLTSTLTRDEDMEWWARAGAWFMIVVVGWIAVHLLVLYGPSAVLYFGDALRDLRSGGGWDRKALESLAKVLTVVGGVLSGFITLVGGFSGKTPANSEEAKSAGLGARLLGWLTSLLAPVFFSFLMILLALGTNWLLVSLSDWFAPQAFPRTAAGLLSFPLSDHATLVLRTPLWLVSMCGVLFIAIGTLMGMLINTNKFSLHYMWRDRIIRAYLGASRDPARRNPQPFTNFDTDDNIYMCELREQPHGIGRPEVLKPRQALGEESPVARRKLFHVLNIALNLAGGDKLAWQDRKAESFTVSPLHAGSYWLGYRRTRAYGGDDGGITLGTAVAISGAFVSPNMGYMMSSPVVRFLMTLFNVRFGWWLGNPGAAGDDTDLIERAIGLVRHLIGFGKKRGKPFESASPLLSVLPIASEAFGKTDDKSPYVYLSDGGHFENLGLYEMVLRRCRFIVVCDASTDAAYSFDSLAQSIRQIRVDLGVPIEMRDVSISPPSQGLRGKYCSVGKIRYSCVDRRGNQELEDADFDGTLIYIKASMIGEEPRDVINYGRGSKTFPQEVIVDQWFSEAQFESYRALGSHIIDAICSGNQRETNDQNRISLAAFERKAREHNQLNFRAFRERAEYAALSRLLGREMSDVPAGYAARVKAFLKEIVGS